MKTSNLTGAALDWAVAKCEGFTKHHGWDKKLRDYFIQHDVTLEYTYLSKYTPSTDWAQGGPIIERERICITANMPSDDWFATNPKGHCIASKLSPTPLIAAMRCYVASKLGDEVEIPGELK